MKKTIDKKVNVTLKCEGDVRRMSVLDNSLVIETYGYSGVGEIINTDPSKILRKSGYKNGDSVDVSVTYRIKPAD